MPIIIIDCGTSNLRSVQKALESINIPAEISRDPSAIKSARGLILPGVGSFDHGIKFLRQNRLEEAILEEAGQGKFLLGICLGMQLLFEESEEGKEKGLGIMKGKVKKFQLPKELKIPHMGWNRLLFNQKNALLTDIEEGLQVYFVHSYYVAPKDESTILTTTDYGINFASSVCQENIFGTQFHPEKSGKTGLQILRNFANIVHSKK